MRACRICLITNVRLTKIKDQRLVTLIEKIFKNDGFNQPICANHYSCLECKILLRKTCNFIEKALKGQQILYDLIKKNKVITTSLIESIDRKGLDLYSRLSYHKVKVNLRLRDHRDPVLEEEPVVVKLENDEADTHEYDTLPCTELDYLWLNGDLADADENDSKIELFKLNKKRLTKFERPKGVKISVENIIEGKRKSRKPVRKDFIENSSNSDGEDREYQKRRSIDADFDPKNVSDEDTESSSTSYDERGKPKAKIKDKREYPMKCDHCDYIVPERKIHYRHYLFCHKPEDYPYKQEARYICSVCGITKSSVSHLNAHEQTHGEKTEKCNECGKMFHNKKRLQRHVKVVHGDTQYFCDYCNKGFKGRSEIVLHIRTHTGEKPFKCTICGAGFAHKGNIKSHMNSAHAYPYEPKDDEDVDDFLDEDDLPLHTVKKKTLRKRRKRQKKIEEDSD